MDFLINELADSIFLGVFFENDKSKAIPYVVEAALIDDYNSYDFLDINNIRRFLEIGFIRFRDYSDSSNWIDVPIKNMAFLLRKSFYGDVDARCYKKHIVNEFSMIDGSTDIKYKFYFLKTDEKLSDDVTNFLQISGAFSHDSYDCQYRDVIEIYSIISRNQNVNKNK